MQWKGKSKEYVLYIYNNLHFYVFIEWKFCKIIIEISFLLLLLQMHDNSLYKRSIKVYFKRVFQFGKIGLLLHAEWKFSSVDSSNINF